MGNKKQLVCNNPWCKGTFFFEIEKAKEVDGKKIFPKVCNKCESFDHQMSGGLTWEDRKYDELTDTSPHEINYKVNTYRG